MTTTDLDRLAGALAFATRAHGTQVRKGTTTPYISHPLAVAALTMEYGGTVDQAVAALLHDTVEDCRVTFPQITAKFGAAVAGMVRDCTDSTGPPDKKAPWPARKAAYIAHLRAGAGDASLLVSLADKVHNAEATIRDYNALGPEALDRFRPTPKQIVWYYGALLDAFKARGTAGTAALTARYEAAVAALIDLLTPHFAAH